MIYHLQIRPMIFQGAAGQFPFVLLLTNLAANGSDRCNLVWEWRWKMGYQDMLQASSDLLFSNYPVFWGLILSNTHLIGHGAWSEICHENRIRFAPGIWMICWTYITIAGSNIIFLWDGRNDCWVYFLSYGISLPWTIFCQGVPKYEWCPHWSDRDLIHHSLQRKLGHCLQTKELQLCNRITVDCPFGKLNKSDSF